MQIFYVCLCGCSYITNLMQLIKRYTQTEYSYNNKLSSLFTWVWDRDTPIPILALEPILLLCNVSVSVTVNQYHEPILIIRKFCNNSTKNIYFSLKILVL